MMNRQFLTAVLSLSLAACGGMETDDAEYLEFGDGEQALNVALIPVGSAFDPRAQDQGQVQEAAQVQDELEDRGGAEDEGDETTTQVVVIGEIPGDSLLVVTTTRAAYPGATASSTQDPIPARIRHDHKQDRETSTPGRPR